MRLVEPQGPFVEKITGKAAAIATKFHLTQHAATGEGPIMQKTILAAATIAAFLSLSACNNEPETITSERADTQAAELEKAPKVELPPAIQASHTYRCKDNSLVYIDFYTNSTAMLRTEKGGTPTVLAAGEGGQPPYVAEGYSLSGSGDQVSLTAPGKGTQSCKA